MIQAHHTFRLPFLVTTLLLTLTTGCGHYVPQEARPCWRYQCADSPCTAFRSSRVTLPPQQPCGMMGLELTRDCTGLRLDIYTRCYYLSSQQCEGGEVDVTIQLRNQEYRITAFGFRGGQRCQLPEEVAETLIKALWNREEVTVCAGIHKMNLSSSGFRQAYHRLTQTH